MITKHRTFSDEQIFAEDDDEFIDCTFIACSVTVVGKNVKFIHCGFLTSYDQLLQYQFSRVFRVFQQN